MTHQKNCKSSEDYDDDIIAGFTVVDQWSDSVHNKKAQDRDFVTCKVKRNLRNGRLHKRISRDTVKVQTVHSNDNRRIKKPVKSTHKNRTSHKLIKDCDIKPSSKQKETTCDKMDMNKQKTCSGNITDIKCNRFKVGLDFPTFELATKMIKSTSKLKYDENWKRHDSNKPQLIHSKTSGNHSRSPSKNRIYNDSTFEDFSNKRKRSESPSYNRANGDFPYLSHKITHKNEINERVSMENNLHPSKFLEKVSNMSDDELFLRLRNYHSNYSPSNGDLNQINCYKEHIYELENKIGRGGTRLVGLSFYKRQPSKPQIGMDLRPDTKMDLQHPLNSGRGISQSNRQSPFFQTIPQTRFLSTHPTAISVTSPGLDQQSGIGFHTNSFTFLDPGNRFQQPSTDSGVASLYQFDPSFEMGYIDSLQTSGAYLENVDKLNPQYGNTDSSIRNSDLKILLSHGLLNNHMSPFETTPTFEPKMSLKLRSDLISAQQEDAYYIQRESRLHQMASSVAYNNKSYVHTGGVSFDLQPANNTFPVIDLESNSTFDRNVTSFDDDLVKSKSATRNPTSSDSFDKNYPSKKDAKERSQVNNINLLHPEKNTFPIIDIDGNPKFDCNIISSDGDCVKSESARRNNTLSDGFDKNYPSTKDTKERTQFSEDVPHIIPNGMALYGAYLDAAAEEGKPKHNSTISSNGFSFKLVTTTLNTKRIHQNNKLVAKQDFIPFFVEDYYSEMSEEASEEEEETIAKNEDSPLLMMSDEPSDVKEKIMTEKENGCLLDRTHQKKKKIVVESCGKWNAKAAKQPICINLKRNYRKKISTDNAVSQPIQFESNTQKPRFSDPAPEKCIEELEPPPPPGISIRDLQPPPPPIISVQHSTSSKSSRNRRRRAKKKAAKHSLNFN